jgi:hypothetical protein
MARDAAEAFIAVLQVDDNALAKAGVRAVKSRLPGRRHS